MSTSSTDPRTSADLADRVRSVHRYYPTGVTIVTSAIDGRPFGLAVNAFSSLSLDPPMVLVCVAATAASYPGLFQQDRMAVNILAHDQAEVAQTFGRSNPDKFTSVAWKLGEHGAPLLEGVAASFELRIESRIPAHTHSIFVGRILEAHTSEKWPLLYVDRRFFDSTTVPELVPALEGVQP
ncbi:flavin reductase family protein [Nocardia sp. NPDC052112]|uniref:flavin reductase family protein n=1 Tax=Nocardia sp. NPDC052112 TaxID=3155646 RepID=UPI00342C069B